MEEAVSQGRGEPWWPGPVARFSLSLALAPPRALLLVAGWRDLDLATQSLLEDLLEDLASPAAARPPALGLLASPAAAWPPALGLLASWWGALPKPELLELAGSPMPPAFALPFFSSPLNLFDPQPIRFFFTSFAVFCLIASGS